MLFLNVVLNLTLREKIPAWQLDAEVEITVVYTAQFNRDGKSRCCPFCTAVSGHTPDHVGFMSPVFVSNLDFYEMISN